MRHVRFSCIRCIRYCCVHDIYDTFNGQSFLLAAHSRRALAINFHYLRKNYPKKVEEKGHAALLRIQKKV